MCDINQAISKKYHEDHMEGGKKIQLTRQTHYGHSLEHGYCNEKKNVTIVEKRAFL